MMQSPNTAIDRMEFTAMFLLNIQLCVFTRFCLWIMLAMILCLGYARGYEVDQVNAEAQYNLGICYLSGTGVAKNEAEAIKWFRKAAEQEHVEAMFSLGGLYMNGIGVEKNDIETVKWFRKAAEHGHVEAMFSLGGCYFRGVGVVKNEAEAIKWFRKAAEQGDSTAQFGLGVCFLMGYGVQKNEVESVKWFRKAAEQGDARAQNHLGICYKNGYGVVKNEAEAVRWFSMAATSQKLPQNITDSKILEEKNSSQIPSLAGDTPLISAEKFAINICMPEHLKPEAEEKLEIEKLATVPFIPFSTKNHKKANGFECKISFPDTWKRAEGERAQIIQKAVTSHFGFVITSLISVKDSPNLASFIMQASPGTAFHKPEDFKEWMPESSEFLAGGLRQNHKQFSSILWYEYIYLSDLWGRKVLHYMYRCNIPTNNGKVILITFTIANEDDVLKNKETSKEKIKSIIRIYMPTFHKILHSLEIQPPDTPN